MFYWILNRSGLNIWDLELMGLFKDFQSTFRKAIGLLMASKGYNIAHKILMYNFYINCLIEQFQNIQYRHIRTVSDNPSYPSYLQDYSVHSTTRAEVPKPQYIVDRINTISN